MPRAEAPGGSWTWVRRRQPGRLLCGITDIDPIRYNLIFERFLNPERVSMPDFDVDFCYERRQEVIDYVNEKYGRDHVAQIVTFGTMAAATRCGMWAVSWACPTRTWTRWPS